MSLIHSSSTSFLILGLLPPLPSTLHLYQVGDIRDKIVPDFLAWFANYLVVKRAAQEANYHSLYISLCDKVWGEIHAAVLVLLTWFTPGAYSPGLPSNCR